jgi:hypothetical protein
MAIHPAPQRLSHADAICPPCLSWKRRLFRPSDRRYHSRRRRAERPHPTAACDLCPYRAAPPAAIAVTLPSAVFAGSSIHLHALKLERCRVLGCTVNSAVLPRRRVSRGLPHHLSHPYPHTCPLELESQPPHRHHHKLSPSARVPMLHDGLPYRRHGLRGRPAKGTPAARRPADLAGR